MEQIEAEHWQTDLRASVYAAYEILLRRPPENEEVVAQHARHGSAAQIFRNIAASPEALSKYHDKSGQHGESSQRGNPLYNFAAMFDVEGTIRQFERHDLTPQDGYFVNFLGVKIEPRYYPPVLADKAGKIEAPPIPGNWHADMAEWAAVLRAVNLARETFRVIELGCGWGCWLNNAGVAARARGLKPMLIGVEGDHGHLGFARDCCANNGFESSQVELHYGIAAAERGMALFPRQAVSGADWGLEPLFGVGADQRRDLLATDRYDELPMVALCDLVAGHERIDLLHIDIQGGEADLIEQSLDLLTEKVAYIFVGTHSRVIEGRVTAALLGAGWLLEVERPAIVELTETGPVTQIDGSYGWRNPALARV